MRYSRLLGITVRNSNSHLGNIQTEKCRLAAGLENLKELGDTVYCTQTPYRSSNKDSQGVSESSKAFFSPSTSPSCQYSPSCRGASSRQDLGRKAAKTI
jgi:hypothetical protein